MAKGVAINHRQAAAGKFSNVNGRALFGVAKIQSTLKELDESIGSGNKITSAQAALFELVYQSESALSDDQKDLLLKERCKRINRSR